MELTVPYKILCIGSQNAPSFDDPQIHKSNDHINIPKDHMPAASHLSFESNASVGAIIHAVTDVQSEKSKIRAFLSESIGVAWASSNGSRMEAAPWWRRIREMMQYPFGSYAADVWSKGLFMGWMLVEWMILTCWSSLNHGGRRPGQWCEKSWRTNG